MGFATPLQFSFSSVLSTVYGTKQQLPQGALYQEGKVKTVHNTKKRLKLQQSDHLPMGKCFGHSGKEKVPGMKKRHKHAVEENQRLMKVFHFNMDELLSGNQMYLQIIESNLNLKPFDILF